MFHQLTSLVQELQDRSQHLVTASAGNYGKDFAYIAKYLGLNTTVVMPHNAPADRVEIIKVECRFSGVKVMVWGRQAASRLLLV